MSNYPDLQAQVQVAHWGWDIALFLWFVGLSGMGTFAYYWLRRAPLAYMTFITGALGLMVVFSHLTRWWNLPAALFHAVINFSFNWESWMMLGIVMLSVHMVLTLVLCVYHLDLPRRFPALADLGWITAILRWVPPLATNRLMLMFTAAFGVCVTMYSGFLLMEAVGVPLWSTLWLPILWVVSAGVAVLDMLDLMHLRGWIEDAIDRFLMKMTLLVESVKLVVLGIFIWIGYTGVPGAQAGAQSLTTGDLAPMFWLGVVLMGAIVPMTVAGYTLKVRKIKALVAVGAILGLVGGLLLRGSILLAGNYDSLVF